MMNNEAKMLWDDRQLYLAAETMIVARFGVDAVYAELKRIRNDTRKAALAAKDARIQELEAELSLYTDGIEMDEGDAP